MSLDAFLRLTDYLCGVVYQQIADRQKNIDFEIGDRHVHHRADHLPGIVFFHRVQQERFEEGSCRIWRNICWENITFDKE